MTTVTKVHVWPYTTDTDPRIFVDLQGGRIVCRRHLGGYGTTWLNAHPYGDVKVNGRQAWLTPLDMWAEMTVDDRVEFTKNMAEYGLSDARATCEDCGYDPDDAEQRAERETYEAEVEDD